MKIALGMVAGLLLLGLVGRMDYEDQLAQQVTYCEVTEGALWPIPPAVKMEPCRQPSGGQL